MKDTLALFFRKNPFIINQTRIAVAVSGGPDSMALAHALINDCDDKDIHILTVNHGLRDEAKKETEQVGFWVQTLGKANVQHHTLLWEHDGLDSALMEQARHARYELMAEYCAAHDISTLFVGHHIDDQAETFLIRLAKGSGLDGLAAMEELSDYSSNLKIARPFLSASKQDIYDYCEQNNIPVIEDPSNQNDNYLRPRLRQSMEVLSAEGLTTKRLALTAKRIQRAKNALIQITNNAYDASCVGEADDMITLSEKTLRDYPDDIVLRVLQRSFKHFRQNQKYDVRMERLESLFDSLWYDTNNFKPRTLGGCIVTLRNEKLVISLEKK